MNNPPIPEEFNLDESIYNEFRHRKEFLGTSLDNFNSIIESIENNWLINLILNLIRIVLFFAIWPLSFLVAWVSEFLFNQFLVAFNFSGRHEWISLIIILIILAPVFVAPLWAVFLDNYAIARFVRNLFTAGKYNKATEESRIAKKQIEKLTEDVENRVRPFEEAYYNYYKNKLDEFYSTKLYKKRSGTPEFEESLSEFELMLDDLSAVNKVFLTNGCSCLDLREYSEYIKKRKTNHSIQRKNESSIEFAPVSDFVKKVAQMQIKKIPITPEEKYRIPKKIDWDKLLKDRKATGMQGEEAVIVIEQEYLKSVGRDDLANKIRHVSKTDGDGSGYDILSFFPNGNEKYIEVKSTIKSLESPFYISRNELGFLQEHARDSFIYRLLLNSKNIDNLQVNSCSDFFETKELIPTQYIVRNKTRN